MTPRTAVHGLMAAVLAQDIKQVAAQRVSRLAAACPWQDQALWLRAQRIAFHKLTHRLKEEARVNPCVVQSVGFQRIGRVAVAQLLEARLRFWQATLD